MLTCNIHIIYLPLYKKYYVMYKTITDYIAVWLIGSIDLYLAQIEPTCTNDIWVLLKLFVSVYYRDKRLQGCMV